MCRAQGSPLLMLALTVWIPAMADITAHTCLDLSHCMWTLLPSCQPSLFSPTAPDSTDDSAFSLLLFSYKQTKAMKVQGSYARSFALKAVLSND